MKKEINMILELLSEFFNEKNSLSFSLFAWRQNKEIPSCVKIIFAYQIQDNHFIRESSGEYLLFENKKLNESFMNCDSIYDLSEKINTKLNYTIFDEESIKLFNFFSGVEFNKNNWKNTVTDIFGSQYVTPFFINKLKQSLEEKLSNDNMTIEKKTKV